MAMDLSKLTQKTLKVSRGFTYKYYVSPAQGSKPTLILFHGWPDTARLWADLINNHLVPQGYGVVAPDCLGYGGTSKPTDTPSYAWKHMTADAVEILDAEGIPAAISFGHDWGSAMAQRLYNLHPSRVIGLVIVNVTYIPPKPGFDLDAVNAATRKAFGAGIYEYWHFHAADDAPGIMRHNLESLYSMAFGDPATWLENMCSPGGMRRWVSGGHVQPTLPFATAEHKADFMERLSGEAGLEAPSCWYRSFTDGAQNESEEMVAEEDKVVKVPTLYWGGEGDVVCRPATLQPTIDAGLLPDVTKVTREGGHWALLEKPDVFGEDVVGWLQKTYG